MNKASTSEQGPERSQEPPKGFKRPGPQDARTRNENCDFLVLKSMVFSFILHQGQESPQEAPKRPQEPPKGLKPLKKGNPGAGTKGFPDLQINKGLYGP